MLLQVQPSFFVLSWLFDCPPLLLNTKLSPFEELAERRARLPEPVVMTNGVFDILHRGHVTYLAQARELGKSLIVAVNSDTSVKMLGKGDDRPINTEADRAAVLSPRWKLWISSSSLRRRCH